MDKQKRTHNKNQIQKPFKCRYKFSFYREIELILIKKMDHDSVLENYENHHRICCNALGEIYATNSRRTIFVLYNNLTFKDFVSELIISAKFEVI